VVFVHVFIISPEFVAADYERDPAIRMALAHRWIYGVAIVYTASMSKHLVDIDENALTAAQAELGTASMKETVNEALKRAGAGRDAKVREALDRLGRRKVGPREEAWQ
jgi:Arc/MetJ family transcription regulator